MGSTGKITNSSYTELYDLARDMAYDSATMKFESPSLDRWFADNSNREEWVDGLSEDEREYIADFTGTGYVGINNDLYKKDWDDISEGRREFIEAMDEALGRFELKKGITVDRNCNFEIFGSGKRMSVDELKDYFVKNGTTLQNNAFMSFSAKKGQAYVFGSPLIIELDIPASKGAGAYIGTLSYHEDEQEFILNRNAVLNFDPNSIYEDKDGSVHIRATWVGKANKRAQGVI